MDIDLDDAGIRRDVQDLDARIARRRVTLDCDRRRDGEGRRFDPRKQRHVVLEARQRRHEHVKMAVAHLDAQRGLDHVLGRDHRVAALELRFGCGEHRSVRQVAARREGIDRYIGIDVLGRHVGQRFQRQPQPKRRIAGKRIEALALQRPRAALPASDRLVVVRDRPQRQHEAGGTIESLLQQPRQTGALVGLRQVRLQRIGVERQRRFRGEQPRHVLVGGDDERRIEGELRGERRREPMRRGNVRIPGRARVGEQRRVVPQRLAVGAPPDPDRPPRQRLAGVPLSLARMREAPAREAAGKAMQQRLGELALFRRQRRVVPLGAVHVVARHERRLAALRQPNVVPGELGVDATAEIAGSHATARRRTAWSRADPRARGSRSSRRRTRRCRDR